MRLARSRASLGFLALTLIVAIGAVGWPCLATAQGASTVYLPLALNAAEAGHEPISSRPSEQLIEEAESAGSITHVEALVYKVFAAFGDSRLPSQFASSAVTEDSQVMAQVRAEWDALSPQAQQDLAPFLLPPNEPGSWLELPTLGAQSRLASQAEISAVAIEWRSVVAASGVKVWYQTRYDGDDAKAAGLVAAIDARIRSKLREVMGEQSWLPDGGLPKNGGDERLDIYLVRPGTYRGLTTPYTACKKSAVWIWVDSDRILGDETHPGIVQTAAHEMMHAVQYAYPRKEACSSYDWLAEASAKWFEDFAYEDAQSEQPYAPAYLKTAYLELENTSGARHYGAYLYPFLVSHERRNPSAVRAMWENGNTMDSLKAVNEAARFETYWEDFVRYNWNREPATKYQDWDSLPYSITPHGPDIEIRGQPRVVDIPIALTLPHLSAQYYHFRFTDANARSVMFYNGATYNLTKQAPLLYPDDREYDGEIIPAASREGISVQALYKVEGEAEWKSADWTFDLSVGFCRDAKAERLEELVLIFANAQYDRTKPSYTYTPPGDGPRLVYSDVGCWQWKGNITATYLDPAYISGSTRVNTVTLQRSVDWLSEEVLYQTKSGSGSISYRWRNEADNQEGYTDGAQAFTLTPANTYGSLLTHNLAVSGPTSRAYHVLGDALGTSASYSFHYVLEDDPDHDGLEDYLETGEVGRFLKLPNWNDANVRRFGDGAVMQGSYTVDNVRYDCHLEAQREP